MTQEVTECSDRNGSKIMKGDQVKICRILDDTEKIVFVSPTMERMARNRGPYTVEGIEKFSAIGAETCFLIRINNWVFSNLSVIRTSVQKYPKLKVKDNKNFLYDTQLLEL